MLRPELTSYRNQAWCSDHLSHLNYSTISMSKIIFKPIQWIMFASSCKAWQPLWISVSEEHTITNMKERESEQNIASWQLLSTRQETNPWTLDQEVFAQPPSCRIEQIRNSKGRKTLQKSLSRKFHSSSPARDSKFLIRASFTWEQNYSFKMFANKVVGRRQNFAPNETK